MCNQRVSEIDSGGIGGYGGVKAVSGLQAYRRMRAERLQYLNDRPTVEAESSVQDPGQLGLNHLRNMDLPHRRQKGASRLHLSKRRVVVDQCAQKDVRVNGG